MRFKDLQIGDKFFLAFTFTQKGSYSEEFDPDCFGVLVKTGEYLCDEVPADFEFPLEANDIVYPILEFQDV